MSGIVALLQLDSAPVDAQWLATATGALRFRGPDAQRTWQDGSVGLGHALLRTTFEDANDQQPCTLGGSTLDGKVWLVADARIDDRVRLLDELRAGGQSAGGQKIESDCPDSHLILHAYQRWGEACLDHLIGDFGFVLWDAVERRLFCARDQMGAVPIYYARCGQTLVISNTLNTVRAYPGISAALNDAAVADYLLFHHYVDNDSTIYAQIRRLPPAHNLTLTLDPQRSSEPQIRRYWQLPDHIEYLRERNPNAIVEQFRHLFDQAVGDRLRTRCAGTSLSGGMDSTSIAVTAKRLLDAMPERGELRGATLVYRELMREDEGPYAQEVANFAGFPTQMYVVEDTMRLPFSLDPIHHEPEPWSLRFLTTETYMLRDVAGYARTYFLGFGGDPLLASVQLSWHQAVALGQWRAIARRLRRRWRSRNLDAMIKRHNEQKRAELSPILAARVDIEERQMRYAAINQRDNQQRGMSNAPMWESFFRVSDPGFTQQPVRVRFPFFDLRLVNFMLRLPPDPWTPSKFLLREAMRGALPESVRQRRKTTLGFYSDPRYIYEDGVPAWITELLAMPALAEYVNVPLMRSRIERVNGVSLGTFGEVASSLVLAYWLRTHS